MQDPTQNTSPTSPTPTPIYPEAPVATPTPQSQAITKPVEHTTNQEVIIENVGNKKTIYLSIKSVAFIVVFSLIILIVLLYINGRGLYDQSSFPMQ